MKNSPDTSGGWGVSGGSQVADFSHTHSYKHNQSNPEDMLMLHSAINIKTEALLSMLKRRPCSLNDICTALGISQNEIQKHISDFQHRGVIHSEEIDGIVFYKAIS